MLTRTLAATAPLVSSPRGPGRAA